MNKGFTLVQVVLGVAVTLILSSVAVVSYQKIVQMGREEVCATNQQALTNAVKAYVGSGYVIPAVLGDLKLEHLEKAYARVMEDAGWWVKFSHFLVRTSMSNEAYAQFLTYDNLKNYGAQKDFFRCPSDPNGGVSYGINGNIAGKYWYEIGDNVMIVGDCDSHVFTAQGQLTKRHGSGQVAIAVTKVGSVVRIGDQAAASSDDADDPTVNVYDSSDVNNELSEIVNANQGTALADKMEDVIDYMSQYSSDMEAGNKQGAAGAIEGAVINLQAAVDDGLLDAVQGKQLMDNITEIARQLAVDAIAYAMNSGGDSGEINNAQQQFDQADALRASENFMGAVSQYRDALSAGESAGCGGGMG
jgi:type II secretory pathway pseudopilin PulG